LGEGALGENSAAELAPPDDESILEQPPLIEMLDQRGCRLISILTLAANGFGEIEVLIPTHVEELHEADIPLCESPCQQAVGGVTAGAPYIRTIEVENMQRLFFNIGQIGNAGLHAEGHFILGDTGLNLGITDKIEASSHP
jgi:hypothetical protein